MALGFTAGKTLSTGVIIAIAVSSFVVGSCSIYFTLPLIGYVLYRLKLLICYNCWRSFEDYQSKKGKKDDKQVLVYLPTKKEPVGDFI